MKNCIIIICFLIVGCSPTNPLPFWQRGVLERPPNTEGQQIPKLYLEGWHDGCRTGLGSYIGFYYQQFYGWTQDPIKAQNQIYYKGWKDAADYCGRYMWGYRRRDFI